MRMKELRDIQDELAWPENTNDLPVVNWVSCTPLGLPSPISHTDYPHSSRTIQECSASPYFRFHP